MSTNTVSFRVRFLIVFVVAFTAGGCGSLLPSAKETKRTQLWGTFDDVKGAFERIIPYQTTSDELQKIGFDPASTPNLRILTYLEIIQRFMFNPSIKKEDLDKGIQECIDAKTNCRAYEIRLRNISSNRYGNVMLDLFNFKRRTKQTGWEFEALVVMVNGTVVHKFWGGTPVIDEDKEVKNPLGPLQNPSDTARERTLQQLP
jgi:hypothetical protein